MNIIYFPYENYVLEEDLWVFQQGYIKNNWALSIVDQAYTDGSGEDLMWSQSNKNSNLYKYKSEKNNIFFCNKDELNTNIVSSSNQL